MFALPGVPGCGLVTASMLGFDVLALLPVFAAPNAVILPTAELPLLLFATLFELAGVEDLLLLDEDVDPVYLELPLAPNAIYKSHS